MRELFESTIERLLGDLITPELLRGCEAGQWPTALWSAIEESGFSLAAVPEALGGAGASWSDLFVVVRAAGRHNLPLPLPEAMLGNALLGHCQLELQSGPLSIGAEGALTMYRGRISGTLLNVPWGRHVQHVVAITGGDAPHVVLLETALAQCTPILNTAGIVASAPLPADVPVDVLHSGGAMLRSAQIAGALQGVLAQTIQYATERVQFGKAIGSFQALQHHMAVLAEHTGCVAVASECAFARAQDGAAGLDALGVAAAKICSAEAAGVATSVAHTVHGAIGFTHEYTLHFATRRLWSWRSEFGNATHWSQRLGQAVCQQGADALWPAITSGQLALAPA
ncbi:MAG: acyl-CoA/acyl-ACP dehydrogenase [Rhodoferax sp.]|nr:acyl-CoA/acyl-ACP dehydrogenase [Rhodoferax sp.]